LKIISIVGARPQFIKCAPLSRELRKSHQELLIHTGQHYDPEMSQIFFDELKIPKPDWHLGVGSGTHGRQTGEILAFTEKILMRERPDLVIVFGDTNSTLGGALAAAKLHIPVAHVEAGLRSFDRTMPEEINRILTDHISDLLFCPTRTATENLAKEGISRGVYMVGDIMVDAIRHNLEIAELQSPILEKLGLTDNDYAVATIHRPGNTDNRENLTSIVEALGESGKKIIFPVHPRTKKYLTEFGLWERLPGNIHGIDPLGYLDMLKLMRHASKIVTDSGGIQKEGYVLGVPCITLRENTEWVETLTGGWNILTGADKKKILSALLTGARAKSDNSAFGKGDTAERIVKIIASTENG
jgi:UDP-GlcNAc3NAcA epimerase